MAVGFSGSNGGVSNNLLAEPKVNIEVSYFINNTCNLNCKHCYVGYENQEDSLSVEEWKKAFEELISLNATTFGNVGKEPLLSWEKTKELLIFLKEKRNENPKIRFGLVTNLTLLTPKIAEKLNEILPDYLDVSLDGIKESHEFIRGNGNFEKTFNNLRIISEKFPNLLNKIFISFVLMKHNKTDFREMLNQLSKIKIKKILISPYVTVESEKKIFSKQLGLTKEEIINFYKEIIKGKYLKELDNFEIIIKNDRDTLEELMNLCIKENLINTNKLLIDEYGVIFNQYEIGSNKIIINYIPEKDLFDLPIRISHDGYVGNCYAQFFKDYPNREEVLGNIRKTNIKEILKLAY